jgi:hypothetical protein
MIRHDQIFYQTCSDTIKLDLKIPDLKKMITRNPTNMWSETPTKACTMHAENCLEEAGQYSVIMNKCSHVVLNSDIVARVM